LDPVEQQTQTREQNIMICYNKTTDRYELYATCRDTDPKHLRGLFRTFFGAWVALCHTATPIVAK